MKLTRTQIAAGLALVGFITLCISAAHLASEAQKSYLKLKAITPGKTCTNMEQCIKG